MRRMHNIPLDIQGYEVVLSDRVLVKCRALVKVGARSITVDLPVEGSPDSQVYKFANALKEHLLDSIKAQQERHAEET